MKNKGLWAVLLLALVLVTACGSGVSQEEYDRATATATALEAHNATLQQEGGQARTQAQQAQADLQAAQEKATALGAEFQAAQEQATALGAKVEQAGKLAAVVDSLFRDIIKPQSEARPTESGPPEGGPPQELIDTLRQQVAAQGNPELQAKLNELLQARDGDPSEEQVREFDRMVRASGDTELIATWEKILTSTGEPEGPQGDLLRGLEAVVQASGHATLEGKFQQFRRANEAQDGISVTRLAEIVEMIQELGKPDLVKQLDDALTARFGGGPLTLEAMARFGTAVRSVEDSALSAMADKVFSSEGGDKAFAELVTYAMGKLTDSLR